MELVAHRRGIEQEELNANIPRSRRDSWDSILRGRERNHQGLNNWLVGRPQSEGA